jgi:hypothetical protein
MGHLATSQRLWRDFAQVVASSQMHDGLRSRTTVCEVGPPGGEVARRVCEVGRRAEAVCEVGRRAEAG